MLRLGLQAIPKSLKQHRLASCILDAYDSNAGSQPESPPLRIMMAAFSRQRSPCRLLASPRDRSADVSRRALIPQIHEVPWGGLMPRRSTTHSVTASELASQEINGSPPVGSVDGSTESKAATSSHGDDSGDNHGFDHERADHHNEPASAPTTVFNGFILLSRATLPTDHNDSIRMREPPFETLQAMADQRTGPPPVIMHPIHDGEANSHANLAATGTFHGTSQRDSTSLANRKDSKPRTRTTPSWPASPPPSRSWMRATTSN